MSPQTAQQVGAGDNATTSILDEFDEPMLICDTSWDGEQIVYTVSNYTASDQLVTWPGTPFESELVISGDTVQHAVSSQGAPNVVFEMVDFVNAETQTLIAAQATTYLPGGEPVPTASEWGLIVLTLLLLTAGTLAVRRSRPVSA